MSCTALIQLMRNSFESSYLFTDQWLARCVSTVIPTETLITLTQVNVQAF